MKKRMEGSRHKNHEDHIAGKGMVSLSHYNFGAQIYSYASSEENTRCKGSIGERIGKKLEKMLTWQLTKVRNKNVVISEARKESKTVQFVSLRDLCHLKNSELEPQFQKTKVELCSEVTL